MEIQGKVKALLPEQTGTSSRTGNSWKAQEFVLDYFWWPNQVFASQMVLKMFGEERIAKWNLRLGDEVKVKQADSWDYNQGGSFVTYSQGMYVYGVGNGPNLVIAEAGTYMIIFNDITGYIRFIKQ